MHESLQRFNLDSSITAKAAQKPQYMTVADAKKPFFPGIKS